MSVETPAAGGSPQLRCFHSRRIRKQFIFNQIKHPNISSRVYYCTELKRQAVIVQIAFIVKFSVFKVENCLRYNSRHWNPQMKTGLQEAPINTHAITGNSEFCIRCLQENNTVPSSLLLFTYLHIIYIYLVYISLSQHNMSQKPLISPSLFQGSIIFRLKRPNWKTTPPMNVKRASLRAVERLSPVQPGST